MKETVMKEEKKYEVVETAKELAYARDAVAFCLEHSDGLVDMHGLPYWANRVETLRHKIKNLI